MVSTAITSPDAPKTLRSLMNYLKVKGAEVLTARGKKKEPRASEQGQWKFGRTLCLWIVGEPGGNRIRTGY